VRSMLHVRTTVGDGKRRKTKKGGHRRNCATLHEKNIKGSKAWILKEREQRREGREGAENEKVQQGCGVGERRRVRKEPIERRVRKGVRQLTQGENNKPLTHESWVDVGNRKTKKARGLDVPLSRA